MHRVVCTQHWSRNWRTRAHTGRWSIPAVSHSCRRAIATTGTPHQCCLYPHPKYILVSYLCLLPVPKTLSLKFKSQLIRVVVIVIAVGTVDDNGCSLNGHAILIHMVVWWYGGMVVWWYGGMVVWWYGGMVVWWYGGMLIWWCWCRWRRCALECDSHPPLRSAHHCATAKSGKPASRVHTDLVPHMSLAHTDNNVLVAQ
jgi:hypothetical protein